MKKQLYLVGSNYFLFWAGISYRRWSPTTVCITGSVGKTTMLHLLQSQFGPSAHYSFNANSVYGVAGDVINEAGITGSRLRWFWLLAVFPIKSLFYKRSEPFYIVEVDADRPYEADKLTAWLNPKHTLWISLSNSHATNFEALASSSSRSVSEVIADEFAKIASNTIGSVLVDGRDQLMTKAATRYSDSVLAIKVVENEYEYNVELAQTSYRFNDRVFVLNSPQPQELVLQLLYLEKLARLVGEDPKYDLTDVVWPPSRSNVLKGIKNTSLLDSSYNAHLQSMKSVIGMFADIKHGGHKWLVVADIIEQGDLEAQVHQELAKVIDSAKPDQIILVGSRTQNITLPLIKSKNVKSFIEASEARDYLLHNVSGDELICFKGSQYLEGIIEAMLLNPDDAQLLCRRGKAASARRAKKGL